MQISPHYSSVALTNSSVDNKTKIIALKTTCGITIVSIDEKDKVHELASIDLEPSISNKRVFINSFTFLRKCGQTPEYSPANGMLIGVISGLIILVDYTSNQILHHFNLDAKKKEPFKKKRVAHIIPIPTCDSDFFVLFSDSSALVYSIDLDQESQIVHEYIERIEPNLPSDLAFHNLELSKKKKILGGTLCKEVITKSATETPELNFISFPNTIDSSKNPLMYFKFNSSTISDAKLFASPALDFLCKGPPQPGSDDYIILLCASFDGFLRVYDFYRLDQLLSFKSIYGSVSSVELTYNGSHAVMGCHDDRIIVLNLRTLGYKIIEGHHSFVTGAAFFLDRFGKVLACSVDGSISMTSIEEGSKISSAGKAPPRPENTNTIENHKSLVTLSGDKEMVPTEYFINKSDIKVSRRVTAKLEEAEEIKEFDFSVPVNEEGIALLLIKEDVFITSSYDGCVSIWKIKKKKEEKETNIKN